MLLTRHGVVSRARRRRLDAHELHFNGNLILREARKIAGISDAQPSIANMSSQALHAHFLDRSLTNLPLVSLPIVLRHAYALGSKTRRLPANGCTYSRTLQQNRSACLSACNLGDRDCTPVSFVTTLPAVYRVKFDSCRKLSENFRKCFASAQLRLACCTVFTQVSDPSLISPGIFCKFVYMVQPSPTGAVAQRLAASEALVHLMFCIPTS